jgi:hypothetical protein
LGDKEAFNHFACGKGFEDKRSALGERSGNTVVNGCHHIAASLTLEF